MKRKIITISDQGVVSVPNNIKMSIYEIAHLFDVFYQTTKQHIRSIEKSGIAGGDYSMSCGVDGGHVYPEYYGLDMIVAVAFRIQSAQAEVFRMWIIRKAARQDITATILLTTKNTNIFN